MTTRHPRRIGLISILLALLMAACTPPPPAATPATPQPTASEAATEAIEPTAAEPEPTADPTEAPETAEVEASATPDMAPELVGSEGIGDDYFPTLGNGGYDVQHYTLDIDVDMATNMIDGSASIEALADEDLGRFDLDFHGFDISELTVNGEEADYEHDGGELIITPQEALPAGQPFEVTVAYEGVPGQGVDPNAAEYAQGWVNYGTGVVVAGEPIGASTWYPVNEHPLDKATYTFRITVDEPLVAAASGVLTDTIDNGDTLTYVWEMTDPMAPYLATVAIGDFERVDLPTAEGGVPVRNYFAADIPEETRADFTLLPEMIAYYETAFGPYPFDVYGVVVHDAAFGFALETQTLAIFGRSFGGEEVIAHELAHMWYGDAVSLTRWQDVWLNEGFATYASWLWAEHSDGEAAFEEKVRSNYSSLAQREVPYNVRPQELAELLARLPSDDVNVTVEEAEAALAAMFEGDPRMETIHEMLSEVPGGTIDAVGLVLLLNELPEDTLSIREEQVFDFLRGIGMTDIADQRERAATIGDPSPDSLFNGQVYVRGAMTLHALRSKVGDDAFFAILQTYYERYRDSNATTEDFIAIAEEISGQDLGEFFDSWLYVKLLPDIPEAGLYKADFLEG